MYSFRSSWGGAGGFAGIISRRRSVHNHAESVLEEPKNNNRVEVHAAGPRSITGFIGVFHGCRGKRGPIQVDQQLPTEWTEHVMGGVRK